ncbi:unnamed protein product, partial [Darwinula stevensoni]
MRPLNETERREQKWSGAVEILRGKDSYGHVRIKEKPLDKFTKTFTFDNVFNQESKQIDVYRSVVQPLVEEVLTGYNCTVFAYGQTGTGKTYTMEGGDRDDSGLPWDQDPSAGLIPRTVSQLFDELRIQDVEFTIRVSYMELYNEELFDLLSPVEDNTKLRLVKLVTKMLVLMLHWLFEDPGKKGNVIISGLEEVIVRNKAEVYQLLQKGALKRRTASTNLNERSRDTYASKVLPLFSSRSHAIFTVTVNIKEVTIDGDEVLKIGKMNLVDLAGSENIRRSGAVDRRAREAGSINQSLLTLARVIMALGMERSVHVPYRESKLTRILQDSLGGRTKTSIIATVGPASMNLDETLSTLDYAQRARCITNKPEINEKRSKKEFIKDYADEIDRLQRDLMAARSKNGIFLAPENYNEMVSRIASLDDELTEKIVELRSVIEEQAKLTATFETLQKAMAETQQELQETKDNLGQTKKRVKKLRRTNKKKEFIVKHYQATEATVTGQFKQTVAAADVATEHVTKLHGKVERFRTMEETILGKSRVMQGSFQQRVMAEREKMESVFSLLSSQINTDVLGRYMVDIRKQSGVRAELVRKIREQRGVAINELGVLIQEEVAELMGKTRVQHDDWSHFVERVCKKMQDDHNRTEKLFSEYEAFDEELGSYIRATFQESQEQVSSLEEAMNVMKMKALETFEILHNMLLQQSHMHSDTLQDVCNMKSFLANQKEAMEKNLAAMKSEMEIMEHNYLHYYSEAQGIMGNIDSRKEGHQKCSETGTLGYNCGVKSLKESEEEVKNIVQECLTSVKNHQNAYEENRQSKREMHQRAQATLEQGAGEITSVVTGGKDLLEKYDHHYGSIGSFEKRLLAKQMDVDQCRKEEQKAEDKSHEKLISVINDVSDTLMMSMKKSEEGRRLLHEGYETLFDDVAQFLGEEIKPLPTTGETPVRQEYKYPRVCAQTSPMERLVERFRSTEGAKGPNESMAFSDEENDKENADPSPLQAPLKKYPSSPSLVIKSLDDSVSSNSLLSLPDLTAGAAGQPHHKISKLKKDSRVMSKIPHLGL